MIDIKWILKNQEDFIKSMFSRGILNADILYLSINDLKKDINDLIIKSENLQREKNEIAKEIGILSKNIENNKIKIEDLKNQSNKISVRIEHEKMQFNLLDRELFDVLSKLPNILNSSVPIGKDENDNVFIRKFGDTVQKKYNHFDLPSAKEELDFERAAKISGSRFVVLKGRLAKLERALMNFMLEKCVEFGHQEISLPYILKEESAFASGQLPKFKDDLFQLSDGKFLIPTSETSMVNLYRDEVIQQDLTNNPIRLCSYSQCFRSEAGAAGKDTKGLIRQHQFGKVELFSITHPDESSLEHDRMLSCAETILKDLNLSYQVKLLCSGDIGHWSSKTYDIEVWMAGQNCYREICSASNTTDFQSKRANIKFKTKNGEKLTPHLLNCTSLAIGRTIVAILENYQIENGDFEIPKILIEKGYYF